MSCSKVTGETEDLGHQNKFNIQRKKLPDSGIFDEYYNDDTPTVELIEEPKPAVKRRTKKEIEADQKLWRESITPDKLRQYIVEENGEGLIFPFIDELNAIDVKQLQIESAFPIRTATMTELNEKALDNDIHGKDVKLRNSFFLCCTSTQKKAKISKNELKPKESDQIKIA